MGSEEIHAHSANGLGHCHDLADHLRGTAARAGCFAELFGAREVAEFLGLVHDVGKASCAWQDGLRLAGASGGRVGIDHKHAGTWLASKRGLDVLAAVVFGHHGGLPSLPDLKTAVRRAGGRERAVVEEAVARAVALVPEIASSSPSLPAWFAEAPAVERELLIRMVFSAVVDGDFLDTEEHFNDGKARAEHPVLAADLAQRFEEGRSRLLAGNAPSPVDAIRRDVYEQALAAASGDRGIYRFPAPTGAGKTLAAGGFALRHARVHGLRRVIVAVPFLSITDQNADVYRRVLERKGEDPVVLEHHSGVDLDEGERSPVGPWRKLAAENWDAPFVVTTTVRLFESLFDRRPSAMRRLHRLAGSVIVLDEVQALPDPMLIPILSALRTLTERFGASVLLASATQPSFWRLSAFKGLPARDVIAKPERLYTSLRRVTYEWRVDPAPTIEEIAADVADERQVLCVVNTTRVAQDLHKLVAAERPEELGPVFHLSTRMVAAHRRAVLADIRRRLADGEPIAVISTQLVEAGVDLDFPVVYRAKAPADSLQQAAGRSNRSGRLALGRVVVFQIDGDESEATVYGGAAFASASHIGENRADPDDLDALDRYYADRYNLKDVEAAGAEIQKYREKFDFPEVAAKFRMIDEYTVPVVVPWGDEAEAARCRDAVYDIRRGVPYAGALLRELRPYMAAIPRHLAREALKEGLAEPVIGDMVHWIGDYHHERGIEFADTQNYIF
ncbi:CRISPR-associated helicase Cas3' [Actinomadura atramentaria]|uniref:CRISPR-associated helicase Cas3' n=1 Tax=Actinomadura atramentaria TaxID=1990 RepID=UPI0003A00FED|nr:CRISPR-associated helicase Cas3' [Actinomadura atramentaria]